MSFADLPLARRLEATEAAASTRFVEARSRLQPAVNAEWIQVNGAFAMFDGPDSPITQTFCLGIFEPPTESGLDQLEQFFFDRGAPVCQEVSPLAGIDCAAALASRGYRPFEFTSVMHRTVEPSQQKTKISTRRMIPGEEQAWSRTSVEGWSDDPGLAAFLLDLGAVLTASEGTVPFLADIDGKPVATGSLHCAGGVALFTGASTIPYARNQGAQQALLYARMNHAHDAGCDLAMMCASPGSASQRNAERQGFRIAYTRTKWRLESR